MERGLTIQDDVFALFSGSLYPIVLDSSEEWLEYRFALP